MTNSSSNGLYIHKTDNLNIESIKVFNSKDVGINVNGYLEFENDNFNYYNETTIKCSKCYLNETEHPLILETKKSIVSYTCKIIIKFLKNLI